MRNLISVGLLYRSTERFLRVPLRAGMTSNHLCTFSGKQSLLELTPAVENKQMLRRSIHGSAPTWLLSKGVNQRQEEMKNYIYASVIGGICLAMFIFSFFMKEHEDYVYVYPDPPDSKKKS